MSQATKAATRPAIMMAISTPSTMPTAPPTPPPPKRFVKNSGKEKFIAEPSKR